MDFGPAVLPAGSCLWGEKIMEPTVAAHLMNLLKKVDRKSFRGI
jgi:hypothetical protein